MAATRLLNRCAVCFCKSKKLDKSQAVIVDGIASGRVVDPVATYNTLIDANCEFGRLHVAYSLLCEMKESGISPDAITYKSLIDGYANRNLLSDSMYLSKDMLHQGIRPDTGTLNSMLQVYFKSRMACEAYMIFTKDVLSSHIAPPDPQTFNIMINGLCKHGDAVLALSLFTKSKHYLGFVPGLVIYNKLFNSLCKIGRLRTARGILKELWESGPRHETETETETTTATTTTTTAIKRKMYNKLMKLCFRLKQCELGLDIISAMRSKLGFSMDGSAYCSVISGLVKAGRMEEANSFKEQMMSDGNIQLDLVCYNTLLHLYLRQGNNEAAGEVLEEIEKAGLEPDQYTHTIIFVAICKAGNMLSALKFFQASNMSFLSNLAALNSLIDCHFKHGLFDEAINLFLVMHERDYITYNTVVHNLCKAGKFVSASKLISRCGFRIHQSTQRAVLDGIRNSDPCYIN